MKCINYKKCILSYNKLYCKIFIYLFISIINSNIKFIIYSLYLIYVAIILEISQNYNTVFEILIINKYKVLNAIKELLGLIKKILSVNRKNYILYQVQISRD